MESFFFRACSISSVQSARQLNDALTLAFRYDRSVLVERAVMHAREIEVGVIGNDIPKTSVPGEVIPSNDFYDYDAKYVDGMSQTVVPAAISTRSATRIRELAAAAYSVVKCEGMARVDFLTDRAGRKMTLD